MSNITLPNDWAAREYQGSLFQYMFPEPGVIREGGRGAEVWHRRSGKDSASLQLQAIASQIRVGTYWTMLPSLVQARKVIWDGIDKFGRRMIDQAFPREMRAGTNHSEMKIEFKNGSIWQCVGSDNYDSLVGTNPVGVVMSEYSIADPRAWDFIRPILRENGGYIIFIYTPRGKNHGFDLYDMARGNDRWHSSLLTIDETKDENGQPVISNEDYLEEIEDGMDPQLALQEFYCSFDAGLFGAYYTDALKRCKVGTFPWNPRLPVHTAWDLGLRDATAIWFFQETDYGSSGGPINVINYMEKTNVPLTEWIKRVHELPYTFGTHMAPHDIETRDRDYGIRSIDTAAEHGMFFDVCPKVSLKTGIDTVKTFLPRLQFDKVGTASGWDTLSNYRREYNDKLRVFMNTPCHDWASHGADAMRYAAVGFSMGFHVAASGDYNIISSDGKRRQIGANNG